MQNFLSFELLPWHFRAQEEIGIVSSKTNRVALIANVFVSQRLHCRKEERACRRYVRDCQTNVGNRHR